MSPPYICKICKKEMDIRRESASGSKDIFCEECDPYQPYDVVMSEGVRVRVPFHRRMAKRIRVVVIIVLVSIVVAPIDFIGSVLGWLKVIVTLDLANLMAAQSDIVSAIFMLPARMFLAFLILFGVGARRIDEWLPEAVRFVRNDLPYI